MSWPVCTGAARARVSTIPSPRAPLTSRHVASPHGATWTVDQRATWTLTVTTCCRACLSSTRDGVSTRRSRWHTLTSRARRRARFILWGTIRRTRRRVRPRRRISPRSNQRRRRRACARFAPTRRRPIHRPSTWHLALIMASTWHRALAISCSRTLSRMARRGACRYTFLI